MAFDISLSYLAAQPRQSIPGSMGLPAPSIQDLEYVVHLPICDDPIQTTTAPFNPEFRFTQGLFFSNDIVCKLPCLESISRKYTQPVSPVQIPTMQRIMPREPICSVYHDSDDQFTPNYSNEFALKDSKNFSSHIASNLISSQVKGMYSQSNLNPNSPSFHLKKNSVKNSQLNPEAEEYIPQHMRKHRDVAPGSEIERKNILNSQLSASYSSTLEKGIEPTISQNAEDISGKRQYPCPPDPEFQNPKPLNTNDKKLCNSASNKSSQSNSIVAVLMTPVACVNIVDKLTHPSPCKSVNEDEASNDTEDDLNNSLSCSEDISFDDNCEPFSIKFNQQFLTKQGSCHPRDVNRTLSESSIDSNDSFQIEFQEEEDENDDDSLEEGSPSCHSCFKPRSCSSPSSDDESSAESENEDDSDDDYSDEFFSLHCEDNWELISRECPVKTAKEGNYLGIQESFIGRDVDEEDECDSSTIYKAINNKWLAEVQKGCKASTPAKVKFCDSTKVHPMVVWKYAYQSARQGPWMEAARDRERFKLRIERAAEALNSILTPSHRARMYSLLHSQQDVT